MDKIKRSDFIDSLLAYISLWIVVDIFAITTTPFIVLIVYSLVFAVVNIPTLLTIVSVAWFVHGSGPSAAGKRKFSIILSTVLGQLLAGIVYILFFFETLAGSIVKAGLTIVASFFILGSMFSFMISVTMKAVYSFRFPGHE